jgi:hypothetical protein
VSYIVLKIPTESQSFRAALTDATIRDRVLEWVAAAVTLDDAVYIPLRTDWMPNGPRRTADGVEVLLAGRWPPEVDAETGPRVSAAIFGRVWEIVCDASPTEENKDVATCGLSGVNEEQTENEVPEEAPVVIHTRATPVNHVDGWSWSRVVTEIRQWADIYPDPLPDPNDISEAEARALLKTIYQHPAVIAEFERRRMVAEATQREYRDARTIQYAIDVGVDLPDPTPPPVTQEFPCTDDGNGDRLVAQYRDSIRYCKTFDAWYLWSGSRWERDETCRMLALAKRVARTIHIEASATTDDRREKVGKWALTSGMLSRLKAMIACAAPAVAVTPDEFDARPELLNCRNGTLELDTLTFREARREDLLTKCCGVDYDPAASALRGSRTSISCSAGTRHTSEDSRSSAGTRCSRRTLSRLWRSSTASGRTVRALLSGHWREYGAITPSISPRRVSWCAGETGRGLTWRGCTVPGSSRRRKARVVRISRSRW